VTLKSKKRLSILSGVIALLVLASFIYVRSHPLVFNESFMEHAHCIVGAGTSLRMYANEHSGRFPYHTNGYGDALVMMNSGWDSALTGPGYNAAVFARVRLTGENAPEAEFGRVYVQGLSETNDPRIALLFDKLPTPGGDHCHFFRRIFAPLVREVSTIGADRRVIRESEWPAFAKRQIELLVAAGIARDEAEHYYSENPGK
jgi:hypothetical protein